MSVAAHLGIALDEYDVRIRTFIPDYQEMIAAGGACVPPSARTIVDLGIGTGALAQRAVASARRATVVGIDADPGILQLAGRRLGARARLIHASFLRADLPRCDAVVASFALHHVRTRAAKATLYRRIRQALRQAGVFVTVDCHPAGDRRAATAQFAAWNAHLRQTYGPAGARRSLKAWSREDVYVPLDAELQMMEAAGLRTEVMWRKGAFAVIQARKGR